MVTVLVQTYALFVHLLVNLGQHRDISVTFLKPLQYVLLNIRINRGMALSNWLRRCHQTYLCDIILVPPALAS